MRRLSSPPTRPKLALLKPTHATGGKATLRATVTTNGTPGTVFFKYGRTTAYDKATTPVTVDANTVARTITEALTGLDDGKTYNFQFVFLNAGGSEGPKTANAKTNTVPRALDDTEAISKLASVEIDVLANDSDADADTLLRAVDADGGAEVFAARVVLKARFANVETVTFYSKGEYVSMNCRIPVK